MTRPRFVGFCRFGPGNANGPRGTAPLHWPTDLGSTFEVGNCRVSFTTTPAHQVTSPTHLVVGHAYAGSAGFPAVALDAIVPSTEPDRAIWGHFVSIAQVTGATRIYRSAMGRLPCYFATFDGGLAFASELDLIAELGGLQLSPDWDAITYQLAHPHLRLPRTCVAGVTELLGGQSLTIGADTAMVTTHWTPWLDKSDETATPILRDPGSAIRSVTLQAVRRLAEPYEHILLGVSGGLDSSIVAASLANAGVKVTLVTLATHDPRGDERGYARLLAAHLGLDLVERFQEIDLVDPFVSHSTHLPRPIGRSFNQSGDALLSAEAEASGADCYFTGAGGDNVFCYLQSAAPVADLLRRGRFLSALRSASDVGIETGAGMAKALRLGIRRAFRSPGYRWMTDTRYLDANAVTRVADVGSHPWLNPAPGALPGTAAHIATILGIENHLEGFHRELKRPMISPLVSKPIVEAAVNIPSWHWCAGGRNRAVARDAFADLLPSEIIDRRSKGTPDGFAAAIYARHRKAIIEFLCDGVLAAHGIIDRDAIARMLHRPGPTRDHDYVRHLALCDAEAWTRALTTRPCGSSSSSGPIGRREESLPGGI